MQNRTKKKKKKRKDLDEVVFFEKGKQICMRQMQEARRNTRELHLELVGDKVTYVRVY